MGGIQFCLTGEDSIPKVLLIGNRNWVYAQERRKPGFFSPSQRRAEMFLTYLEF
jgi:hypothetical protein